MTDAAAPFQIAIDPAAVERAVSEAVVNSALGERLLTALREKFPSYQFDQVIKAAIDDEIRRIVVTELQTGDLADLLRAQTRAALTEQLTDEVVGRIVTASLEARRYA